MASVLIPRESQYEEKDIVYVRVGSDDLEAGNVVIADVIDPNITAGENRSVYTATQITSITAAKNAVIIWPDEPYKDAMGNRVGVTDPTQFVFREGDIVRAIRIRPNMKMFLSSEGYTGTPVAGQYLIPAANAYTLAASANLVTDPDFAFKAERINSRGTFVGLGALTGVEIRVVRMKEE